MQKIMLPLKAALYCITAIALPYFALVAGITFFFNGVPPSPWGMILAALLFPVISLAIYVSPRFFKGDIFAFNPFQIKALFPYIIALIAVGITVFITSKIAPDLFPTFQLAGADTLMERLIVLLIMLVLAPIAEELLFRGFLMSIFKDRGFWGSLIITSALFALIHGLNPVKLAITFTLGLILGHARLTLNSLKASMALHMLNNLVSAFFLTLVWIK